MGVVYLVGAGPGDEGLLTVRGRALLESADCVVYDRLGAPGLLGLTKPGCECIDVGKTAGRHTMPQAQIEELLVQKAAQHAVVVRLKGGDPFVFGRGGEELAALRRAGVAAEVVPGVSSFCGAAAALRTELTLPQVSQTVIITRAAGRTPVPQRESIRALAAHQSTMVLFLSTSLTETLQADLLAGGYPGGTPAAVVYKATWPEERIFRCTVDTLHQTVMENGLSKTALIIVGSCMGDTDLRSLLYHPGFSTGYREASQ